MCQQYVEKCRKTLQQEIKIFVDHCGEMIQLDNHHKLLLKERNGKEKIDYMSFCFPYS